MITNQKPLKSCIVTNTVKRITTTIDTLEIVEEFDLKSELLVLRKIRRNRFTNTPWEYEVGFEVRKTDMIQPSGGQPMLVRLDTKIDFCWRISNLLYSAETYKVEVLEDFIKVSTTNKKYRLLTRYFTRIKVPAMDRAKLPLCPDQLFFEYSPTTDTLMIKYAKPPLILQREEQERQERKTLGTKEQESNCNQQ